MPPVLDTKLAINIFWWNVICFGKEVGPLKETRFYLGKSTHMRGNSHEFYGIILFHFMEVCLFYGSMVSIY